MNLSYSTDILQHKACRVWAAEQLVLMMLAPVKERAEDSTVQFHAAVYSIICRSLFFHVGSI